MPQINKTTEPLTRHFLDLEYNLALGPDLVDNDLMLPNNIREWPFRMLNPWDRYACMGNAILECAHALGIELPRINPFYDPKASDGQNFVPTTYMTETDYWRMYWACVKFFKTGELPS